MNRMYKYFYSSFMMNKHGFFTFYPHAKWFHPYFGFFDIGFPTGKYGEYYNYFLNNKLTFKHYVKIYFPEIKEGVIYINKIKYSLNANPIDDVKINYKLNTNSDYLDYVEIKDHIAEFNIDIELDKNYIGLMYPVEIYCDYIDIKLFEQTISIVDTASPIRIIPYLVAYKTNEPIYYLRVDSNATLNLNNINLTYTLLLPKESKNFISKFNIETLEAYPMFIPGEKNRAVYLTTINAFVTSYALEDIELLPKDVLPIINSAYFNSSCEHCKKGAQSFWYTKIYDRNWTLDDLPGAPCMCETKYSVDETRGYVWYKFLTNYSRKDEDLLKEALSKLPPQALLEVEYYNSFYKKKTIQNTSIAETNLEGLNNVW